MKTMAVDELKAQFSEALGQMLKSGEPIAISYGKKKIAAIVPYSQIVPKTARTLGLMKGRARCVIHGDFALSGEKLLGA